MNSPLLLHDFFLMLPLLAIASWTLLLVLVDSLGDDRSAHLGPLTICGLLLTLGMIITWWIKYASPSTTLFGGMLLLDRFSLFLDGTVVIAAILTVLMSTAYVREHRMACGGFYTLLLLSVCGMMLLLQAGDFVTLLLGLEIMSLSIYALVTSWVGNRTSSEAGLKYFIFGAAASAIFLYGIALLYGATGQTNLAKIGVAAAQNGGQPLFLLGLFFILAALAFKIALVPFHAWVPDAYEGAPTTVTSFMSAAVKAAGFGVLLRVLLTVFGDDLFIFGRAGWSNILWLLAILTMTISNITALRQQNIKRMLAYSSISHAGYILVGVLAAATVDQAQVASVLYYLLAYTFTTLGAFGMLAWIGNLYDESLTIDDWAGLSTSHPAAAAAMTIFLLSLGGLPPTAGFFAKFNIFRAALQNDQLISLVVIAALNSVVSMYYYLRPVVAMYFREEQRPLKPLQSNSFSFAIIIIAVAVLLLGLLPTSYLNLAQASIWGR